MFLSSKTSASCFLLLWWQLLFKGAQIDHSTYAANSSPAKLSLLRCPSEPVCLPTTGGHTCSQARLVFWIDSFVSLSPLTRQEIVFMFLFLFSFTKNKIPHGWLLLTGTLRWDSGRPHDERHPDSRDQANLQGPRQGRQGAGAKHQAAVRDAGAAGQLGLHVELHAPPKRPGEVFHNGGSIHSVARRLGLARVQPVWSEEFAYTRLTLLGLLSAR